MGNGNPLRLSTRPRGWALPRCQLLRGDNLGVTVALCLKNVIAGKGNAATGLVDADVKVATTELHTAGYRIAVIGGFNDVAGADGGYDLHFDFPLSGGAAPRCCVTLMRAKCPTVKRKNDTN